MSKPTRPEPVSYELLFDERQNRRYGSLNLFYFASEAKEYMDALETKNAELQKQVDREYAMRKELGKQYLRAVELLGKVRDAHHLPGSHCEMEDAVVEVDAFLSEMGEPGNENPCPKCGRYHLTECEEDTHE
jgi:hypothetical protein